MCLQKGMKVVLLDTSFLLMAVKYRIDIQEGLRKLLDERFSLAIVDKTLKELEGKKLGRVTQEILERMKVGVIATTEAMNVDNLLLSRADAGTIVATQDKRLKERLKKRKIPVIGIRQKSVIRFA